MDSFLRLMSMRSLLSRGIVTRFYSASNSQAVKHVPPAIFVTEKKRESISNMLQNLGFSKGQISYIFKSPQCVLSLSSKDLSDNLLRWFQFNEMNPKLFTALTAFPELLTLDPAYIDFRIKELLTIFTKIDVSKLLVTSPNVFLDDFSDITEKVQYIIHHMRVEQKSIVKSCALQFELTHIKCRHNFMVRSGHFRIPKKEEKSKNPPLNKIFSSNIETFLKLTKLTKEEYLVFYDYYSNELMEEESDEDDDFEE